MDRHGPRAARRLIEPRSPAASTSGGRRRELPADLQRDAARRLGFVSLLVAGLSVVGTVLYHYLDRVVGSGESEWRSLQASDGIVALMAVLSLALFFYVRRAQRHPQAVLDLGLAYMVVIATLLGLMYHWEPSGLESVGHPSLSWIGVAVLIFAATLPNQPVKVLWAGLLSVAMNPLGMLVGRARGQWTFDGISPAFLMHYPDVLLVGVAVAIAHVVNTLGQQVAKAREMGSYELGELIGRGGMGEVYRATHRMLARPAAIKLIRPDMLHAVDGAQAEQAIARFSREARAAANLRSPHTVGLYDFGSTDDGTWYFAMELLDGLDLESLVRETGPLPASRVVHILRQVCASLGEAHARGLVHRDIKPANIHLGRVGLQHDFAKVLDFGIVKGQPRDDDRTVLGTVVGTVLGTPAYMAPEVALGDPIDGRADVYALGCVAYFALTGQVVFEASTVLQAIARRVKEDPVPPSQRTELPIPSSLEAIVLACLARRPEDRPSGAAALSARLASVDVPLWTDEQAAAWWSVHRPSHDSPAATQ